MTKESFTEDELAYMRDRMIPVPGEETKVSEPDGATVRHPDPVNPDGIGGPTPPPPGPGPEVTNENDDGLDRLTAEVLRDMLRNHPSAPATSGTKQELIDRLRSLPPVTE